MPIVERPIDWEGALVDLLVGVHAARKSVLQRLNMPVPAPIPVVAQIDTGAHCSGMDVRVLRALGLDGEVDIEEVFTCSTGDEPHPCPVYLADLTLIGAEGNRSFGTMRVLAHTFSAGEKARATVGRDLLAYCCLEYYGAHRRFRLSF
jgi:hypothetical protein